MDQSQLFGKTTRDAPADEVSVNSKLLVRAGFIDKLMAGSYSYLPLGLRVFQKIATIIRAEMAELGGQEVYLPALLPKEPWEKTGRWKDPGREVMYQFTGRGDREYGLGWTHEEIITPLAKKFISSYKDLPVALYQIQTKFRDEPRAKSGLLRGREFSMKDLYSFHASETDLDKFYERVKVAYMKIFARLGLNAIIVEAAGGAFTKYSHEFQVIAPAGEDIIMRCPTGDFAQNREIAQRDANAPCPKCGALVSADRAIEVGNIFKLKTRFSQPFQLDYKDAIGNDKPVIMGCYGIGLGRALGAIVEIYHDARGICWPASIAPYMVHIVALQTSKKVLDAGRKIRDALQNKGVEVLYDDRESASPGEKLADADLIGLPWRAIISEKTLTREAVELKRRNATDAKLIPLREIGKIIF